MGLKVAVLPADKGGCGRYRLIHAALILRDQGHDVEVFDPAEPMPIKVLASIEGKITDVQAPDADVIVVQRLTSQLHVKAIPILRDKGYAVVMDADDDFTCIHPSNAAYTNLHPRSDTPHSWHYNRQAAQDVTLMTVSTERLMSVYGHPGRTICLDNYIPASYLDLGHVDRDTYGWPGSIETHPDDLLAVGNAAQRLDRDGYTFMQAGPFEEKVGQMLGLTQMRATGACEMRYWPSTVSMLGVAWAPLSDTQFNRAKSRLKCLEANAVSVPYVASPRAEYARMTAEGGGGVLASKPKDWYRKTKELLQNASLRRELGEQGHAYAATQTIEAHAWKWMEAWERAREIQDGGSLIGMKATVDMGGR